MFLNRTFINEKNISTINFYEYSNIRRYIIKKIYLPEVTPENYWIKEIGEDEYRLLSKGELIPTVIKFNDNAEYEDNQEAILNNKTYKLLEGAPNFLAYENTIGEIDITITMNNKDRIEGIIKKWGKTYVFDNDRLELQMDIKKAYSDNLTIEEVYSFLINKDKVII